MRELTRTVEIGSTVPIADRAVTTGFCTTGAVTTGMTRPPAAFDPDWLASAVLPLRSIASALPNRSQAMAAMPMPRTATSPITESFMALNPEDETRRGWSCPTPAQAEFTPLGPVRRS